MAAKDEQKDAAENKPSGKYKKWIFIGGGVLITVVAVCVAVFFFMRNGDEEGEEAEGGEKTHETGDKKTHALAIFPFEPLIVNIHDGAELRYLKIKMDFEIKSPEAKADLDPLLAPMQDAILVLLSGKQLADISTTEGKNRLKAEIMGAVNRIAPPGRILKVYFTDFVVQ